VSILHVAIERNLPMYRPKQSLLLALFIIASIAAAGRAQARDEAQFFTPSVVEQANAQIRDIRDKYKKDVLIETIPSIPEDQKDQLSAKGKERFFADYSAQRAQSAKIDGIYVLICKDPTYLKVAVGNNTARSAFTTSNRDELARTMLAKFRAKDY